MLEVKVGCRSGLVDPEVAEVLGLKEALSWIKVKGWGAVVIETDCYAVVQAVRSAIVMVSPFGMLVKDCKSLLASLREVFLLFVYRSVNSAAHSFARAAYSYPDHVFRGMDVPTEFLPILLDDLRS